MRVFAFALLLAAGCAQVPASPTAPATVAAAAPAAVTSAEPSLPAPVATSATAHDVASALRAWDGGLDVAQLEAQGQRVRELRAELRGGYERAMMRLRGRFTLPTAYRRDANETTVSPSGWAPIRSR